MLAGREGIPARTGTPAQRAHPCAPRVGRRVLVMQDPNISSWGSPGEPCPARGALWVRSDALHGTWVFHPMEQRSVSFPRCLGHGVRLPGE